MLVINWTTYRKFFIVDVHVSTLINNKHLKNVGPIRHCEPPHADVHNNNNNDNA